MPRQAWAEFDRARELAPESVIPELALAQIYSRLRFDDDVFATVKRLRAKAAGLPDGRELSFDQRQAFKWNSGDTPLAGAVAIRNAGPGPLYYLARTEGVPLLEARSSRQPSTGVTPRLAGTTTR